jgi:hypothetical protein
MCRQWDELTAIQDLLAELPGSVVVADKGYLSDQGQQLTVIYSGVRLVPK